MARLQIRSGEVSIAIELLDTPTARALLAAAPFESRASTWGEEVYFTTPVSVALEPDARQTVAPGTVCFWTEGDALALPFGRTPISIDDQSTLANPCNVLGRIVGDCRVLANIRPGAPIRVEAD